MKERKRSERPEKRGRGRPPKPHRSVHFKLSEDLVEWLDQSAERFDWKKTDIVEEALKLLRTRWESKPPEA